MVRGHGRLIRDTIFKQCSPGSKHWECKCGTRRKDSSRGYENFVVHVRKEHQQDLDELLRENDSSVPSQRAITTSLFKTKKQVSAFGGIQFIVMGLQLFLTVENPVFKEFTKHDNLSYKTRMKYFDLLTSTVEDRIRRLLPKKILYRI